MLKQLRRAVGRVYSGSRAATRIGSIEDDLGQLADDLCQGLMSREDRIAYAYDNARCAAARAFLHKAHKECATELARACAKAVPAAAEVMRRMEAAPPDNPARITLKTNNVTIDTCILVLEQRAQEDFDRRWQSILGTAARCYGSEPTRRALWQLGFSSMSLVALDY
jgi:hypothetical protein